MKLQRLLALAAISVTAFTTLSASAQTKPGLWEVSSKSDAMVQAQKQFAAMPAAQRKMMMDAMAKQSGATMNADGSMAMKVCLTKEMISNPSSGPTTGDCKQTRTPGVGGVVKFSYSCTKPNVVSTEGTVTNSGDTYTSVMTTTATVNGKPNVSKVESKGKFLSADCGAIKPIAVPAT